MAFQQGSNKKMAKIVALQMDPLTSIQVLTDTSFALGLAAQKRGYKIFVYQPEHLSYSSPHLYADGCFVTFTDTVENFYTITSKQRLNLAETDFVLIRQDPPFDLAYITTTHLLELLPKTTRVLNNPQGIRNCPEKLAVLNFPHLMPATLIAKDDSSIMNFIAEQREVVIKPLYEFGGRGVFKFSEEDGNILSLLEIYKEHYREPFIVQQYLPQVSEGDKRILLIDGNPVGVFKRIPKQGHARSNMRIGGKAEICELTSRDREICETIKPFLKTNGLMLAGIDVIGGYLTEINVTSPTGLRVMNRLYNLDLAEVFWDCVESTAP